MIHKLTSFYAVDQVDSGTFQVVFYHRLENGRVVSGELAVCASYGDWDPDDEGNRVEKEPDSVGMYGACRSDETAKFDAQEIAKVLNNHLKAQGVYDPSLVDEAG